MMATPFDDSDDDGDLTATLPLGSTVTELFDAREHSITETPERANSFDQLSPSSSSASGQRLSVFMQSRVGMFDSPGSAIGSPASSSAAALALEPFPSVASAVHRIEDDAAAHAAAEAAAQAVIASPRPVAAIYLAAPSESSLHPAEIFSRGGEISPASSVPAEAWVAAHEHAHAHALPVQGAADAHANAQALDVAAASSAAAAATTSSSSSANATAAAPVVSALSDFAAERNHPQTPLDSHYIDHGLHPADPGLHPADPGLHPADSGFHPADPGLHPADTTFALDAALEHEEGLLSWNHALDAEAEVTTLMPDAHLLSPLRRHDGGAAFFASPVVSSPRPSHHHSSPPPREELIWHPSLLSGAPSAALSSALAPHPHLHELVIDGHASFAGSSPDAVHVVSVRDLAPLALALVSSCKELQVVTLQRLGTGLPTSTASAASFPSTTCAVAVPSLAPLVGVERLTTLAVTNCRLANLSLLALSALSGCAHLTTLDLSSNCLTKLSASVLCLVHLTTLRLHDNRLQRREELALLRSMKHLAEITLWANPLTEGTQGPGVKDYLETLCEGRLVVHVTVPSANASTTAPRRPASASLASPLPLLESGAYDARQRQLHQEQKMLEWELANMSAAAGVPSAPAAATPRHAHAASDDTLQSPSRRMRDQLQQEHAALEERARLEQQERDEAAAEAEAAAQAEAETEEPTPSVPTIIISEAMLAAVDREVAEEDELGSALSSARSVDTSATNQAPRAASRGRLASTVHRRPLSTTSVSGRTTTLSASTKKTRPDSFATPGGASSTRAGRPFATTLQNRTSLAAAFGAAGPGSGMTSLVGSPVPSGPSSPAALENTVSSLRAELRATQQRLDQSLGDKERLNRQFLSFQQQVGDLAIDGPSSSDQQGLDLGAFTPLSPASSPMARGRAGPGMVAATSAKQRASEHFARMQAYSRLSHEVSRVMFDLHENEVHQRSASALLRQARGTDGGDGYGGQSSKTAALYRELERLGLEHADLLRALREAERQKRGVSKQLQEAEDARETASPTFGSSFSHGDDQPSPRPLPRGLADTLRSISGGSPTSTADRLSLPPLSPSPSSTLRQMEPVAEAPPSSPRPSAVASAAAFAASAAAGELEQLRRENETLALENARLAAERQQQEENTRLIAERQQQAIAEAEAEHARAQLEAVERARTDQAQEQAQRLADLERRLAEREAREHEQALKQRAVHAYLEEQANKARAEADTLKARLDTLATAKPTPASAAQVVANLNLPISPARSVPISPSVSQHLAGSAPAPSPAPSPAPPRPDSSLLIIPPPANSPHQPLAPDFFVSALHQQQSPERPHSVGATPQRVGPSHQDFSIGDLDNSRDSEEAAAEADRIAAVRTRVLASHVGHASAPVSPKRSGLGLSSGFIPPASNISSPVFSLAQFHALRDSEQALALQQAKERDAARRAEHAAYAALATEREQAHLDQQRHTEALAQMAAVDAQNQAQIKLLQHEKMVQQQQAQQAAFHLQQQQQHSQLLQKHQQLQQAHASQQSPFEVAHARSASASASLASSVQTTPHFGAAPHPLSAQAGAHVQHQQQPHSLSLAAKSHAQAGQSPFTHQQHQQHQVPYEQTLARERPVQQHHHSQSHGFVSPHPLSAASSAAPTPMPVQQQSYAYDDGSSYAPSDFDLSAPQQQYQQSQRQTPTPVRGAELAVTQVRNPATALRQMQTPGPPLGGGSRVRSSSMPRSSITPGAASRPAHLYTAHNSLARPLDAQQGLAVSRILGAADSQQQAATQARKDKAQAERIKREHAKTAALQRKREVQLERLLQLQAMEADQKAAPRARSKTRAAPPKTPAAAQQALAPPPSLYMPTHALNTGSSSRPVSASHSRRQSEHGHGRNLSSAEDGGSFYSESAMSAEVVLAHETQQQQQQYQPEYQPNMPDHVQPDLAWEHSLHNANLDAYASGGAAQYDDAPRFDSPSPYYPPSYSGQGQAFDRPMTTPPFSMDQLRAQQHHRTASTPNGLPPQSLRQPNASPVMNRTLAAAAAARQSHHHSSSMQLLTPHRASPSPVATPPLHAPHPSFSHLPFGSPVTAPVVKGASAARFHQRAHEQLSQQR